MNRNIVNPALIDAIGEKVVTYYETVDLTITIGGVDTTYYLTNAPRKFILGGNTYESFGQLLDFGNIQENATFEIASLTITLSGLDPYEPNTGDPLLEVMLRDTTEYIDRPVLIKRVYFKDYTVLDSLDLFKGYITTANAVHNDLESTTVGVDVSSHWVDFQTRRGRRTNTNSQQYHFPADVGFEYSVEVQKDIEWKPV